MTKHSFAICDKGRFQLVCSSIKKHLKIRTSEAMIRAVSDLPVPISCTFMYNDGSAGSIYKYYVLLFELLYYLQMH